MDFSGEPLPSTVSAKGFREAAACRWQPGDLVATVDEHRYRVGVVLALPHTPEWMKEQIRPGITLSNDVYLLGFAGHDQEHCHPREAEMCEPLGDVPLALKKRLMARLKGYDSGR